MKPTEARSSALLTTIVAILVVATAGVVAHRESARSVGVVRRAASPEWTASGDARDRVKSWIGDSAEGSSGWQRWKTSRSAATGGASLVGTWREIGPRNFAGRVMAVAFRDRTNPKAILAGAAGGGLFASDDLGQTWRQLGGDQLPSLSIGAIAVDPRDPNTIYAGTGDVNVVRGGSDGVGGILKTTDGGVSFRLLPLPTAGGFFRIVVSSANSAVVLAAATDGIYRSGDAGATWINGAPDLLPTDLLQDTVNPLRFLAVSSDIFGGNGALVESLDEGRTWHSIGQGLLPADQWGRSALALADQPQRTLFLWSGDEDESKGGHPAQLFRSLDDGATWEPIPEPVRDGLHGNNSAYGAHLQVFGSPQGQTLVHHDGFQIYVATQSGGPISSSSSWTVAGGGWHVDTHGIAVAPGGQFWLSATDGGVAVSTDGGVSFYRMIDGFPTIQFYSCALTPGNRAPIYGGTQDNAINIFRGAAGGIFEGSFPPTLGDVGQMSVNPANPAEVVVATSHAFNVDVSTDSGRTWQETTRNGVPQFDYVTTSKTALVRSPLHPNRIYLGAHHFNSSDDGGRHWVPADVRANGVGGIASLAISPSDDSEIWSLWHDGKVFLSTDAGATWTDRSTSIVGHHGSGIAAGPAAGSAYAALDAPAGPRVFRTHDFGVSWADISGDLPQVTVATLLADPRVPGRLLAGTDHGAVISDDDGDHWRPLGDGLPNTRVMDLCFDPTAGRLVAATFGRGLWEFRGPRPISPLPGPVPAPVGGR